MIHTHEDGMEIEVKRWQPENAKPQVELNVRAKNGDDFTLSFVNEPRPSGFGIYFWQIRVDDHVRIALERFLGVKIAKVPWGAGNGHGGGTIVYAVDPESEIP